MSINLVKGQKVELTKGNDGLKSLIVGLGWDVNKYDDGTFDLDASAFLLSENGKIRSEDDFVFYGNKKHSSGSVYSTGDNLTGEGSGDDEQIIVDLSKVPEHVSEIVFVVTIYEAERKMQNFGMVDNSYIRICNKETNEEMLRYDLGEDYSTETGMIMGRLYRHNGEWKFAAVGSGFTGGLGSIMKKYSE